MKRSAWVIAAGVGVAAASAVLACGGGSKEGPAASQIPSAPGGSHDPSKWPADDKSMCDWRSKPELEVEETEGPGALKPNVRRVYKTFGDADNPHKTLVCREIDTNLDGLKDVVRTFNEKGEAVHEEADRDYDGRIDSWIKFVDGRMSEEDTDTNHDGKPDVWKFYVDGKLQRIRRDRNYDGKADVWEIYANDRLERIGYDESFDGHVDRWDRDEQLKYEADEADRKAREQMASQSDAGPNPLSSDSFGAGSESALKDGGAAAPKKPTPKTTAPKTTAPKKK